MDKLKTALDAYYDGIFTARDVLYRAQDIDDVNVIDICNWFVNGKIGLVDAMGHFGNLLDYYSGE